jgi:hypothetical protein
MQLSPQTLKVSIHSVFLRRESLRTMLMVDILKAARIVFSFEHHDKLGTGAYELDGAMIDAPVYKQVCSHSSSFVKKGGGRLMIGIESNYES